MFIVNVKLSNGFKTRSNFKQTKLTSIAFSRISERIRLVNNQHINSSVGIITALPEEYMAMKTLIENPREETIHGERYTWGEIPLIDGGRQQVILVLLAGMGTNLAATGATALLKSFPTVREIILTGIAGGVPDHEIPNEQMQLGDVVVSNTYGSIQFDSLKKTPENSIYRSYPRPPSARLLKAARYLEAGQLAGNCPWLPFIIYAMETLHIQRPARETDPLASVHIQRDSDEPRIFLAPIGSSNILLKDPAQREELHHRFGIKAIEMEAAGVADATWNADAGYLVVRGISDYCDANKNDIWHNYAAVVAAAYVRALLASIPKELPLPPTKPAPSNIVAQYTHDKKTHGCTIHFTLSQEHTLQYQFNWNGFAGDRFTLSLDDYLIIDTGRQFLGISHLEKSFEVETILGSFSYLNHKNHINPPNRFRVSIRLGNTILFEKEDGWNS